MREQNTETKNHIRIEGDLHRRLRIRCAEPDTTIPGFMVELPGRKLSAGTAGRATQSHAAPGRQ